MYYLMYDSVYRPSDSARPLAWRIESLQAALFILSPYPLPPSPAARSAVSLVRIFRTIEVQKFPRPKVATNWLGPSPILRTIDRFGQLWMSEPTVLRC